jgi:anti-anti-sigma factor
MTAQGRIESPSDVTLRAPDPKLSIDAFTAHETCVIHVTGELDLATRDQLVTASTAGPHPTVTIDLGGVTFMDCSGYGSLITSRHIIQSQGGALTITGQTGQPARLFELIAELETCPLRLAPNHWPASLQHLGRRHHDASAAVRVAFRCD